MQYGFVLFWFFKIIPGFYLLAKVEEAADKPIYRWTHQIVSGHTLKHLCAAMVPVFLTLMLAKRTIEPERYAKNCLVDYASICNVESFAGMDSGTKDLLFLLLCRVSLLQMWKISWVSMRERRSRDNNTVDVSTTIMPQFKLHLSSRHLARNKNVIDLNTGSSVRMAGSCRCQ